MPKKMHKPYFENLTKAIHLEEKEQMNRYNLDGNTSLKALKQLGVAIHPLKVSNKTYGYADYPEVVFHTTYPTDTSSFRDGDQVEVFCMGEEAVKGVLLQNEGRKFTVRMFAPDFPDWLEDGNTGLKLAPDTRTTQVMLKGLELVDNWIAEYERQEPTSFSGNIQWNNEELNESQKKCIQDLLTNPKERSIVHGPPGTGKSTTLVELVQQLVAKGEKVLLTAPSNAAVNHLVRLLQDKVNVLRVGNQTKVDEDLQNVTIEGMWRSAPEATTLKKWKRQADELRKMAHQYKRNFGKDERDQRKLILREVSSLRKEIKGFQKDVERTWLEKAQVIAGTPIGLNDTQPDYFHYDSLLMDEASQCLEPLLWCIQPFAKRVILAGDHCQLPPTILSNESAKLGLNISALERFQKEGEESHLLNTQYRMPPELIAFSNAEFYDNRLLSHQSSDPEALYFYDTVGTEAEEQRDEESSSTKNPGEVQFISTLIEQQGLSPTNTAIVTPYSAQVELLRAQFKGWKISTVDSFQGQEADNIIISMVRSNDEGKLGFLTDYRRMNVALTRAKKKLFVFGNSALLGTDSFYERMLNKVDELNGYHSCWELSA